jgi:hypothetical protein
MLRLKTLAAGSAMAAFLALAGPGSASAATEFGDSCTGNNDYSSAVTFFESSAAANPLPLAAPSAGVITKWKVNVVSVPFAFPQTIKLLRLNPSTHTALVVSESPVSLVSGLNAIDARVPVQAGDRLSLFGSGEGSSEVKTLICTTAEENLIGGFGGNGGGPGSSNPYIELPENFRVPLSATIEPDADGDGYGDETQDKCPQSAAVQTACPVVILDAFVLPKKSSVAVIVNTDVAAPVTVSASVKLPNEKKASASATAELKKVTHDVTPGKLRYFSLKYPAALKAALAELPAGKKLKLKITAAATNVAGQVSTDKTIVKLKGAA